MTAIQSSEIKIFRLHSPDDTSLNKNRPDHGEQQNLKTYSRNSLRYMTITQRIPGQRD